jgi:hypothetical protein
MRRRTAIAILAGLLACGGLAGCGGGSGGLPRTSANETIQLAGRTSGCVPLNVKVMQVLNGLSA